LAINDVWAASPHNAVDDEAFNHWNEDDPAEVAAACARCHSTPGAVNFFTGAEAVNTEIGTTIQCEACHNDGTANLSSMTFPSGITIEGLGPSARCMACHQGRESTVSVNLRIAGADSSALTEEDPLGYSLVADIDGDTVNPDLGFANIHYYAAAASLFGSEVHAGYEYPGQPYQIRFGHVEGYTECIDCHDQHSTELKVDQCAECHGSTDPTTYRMNGSLADYDGDGNTDESIKDEFNGVQEALFAAIQAYAEGMGAPITYDEASYPYFFNDAGESYNSWTPNLLEAAYNYHASIKDPGSYAHNAKYWIALMYDSIENLGGDVSGMARNDPGHFDGTAEPFRHWDGEGEVPGDCARCHSADGLPLYLAQGVTINTEPANGFACTTCHASLGGDWPRYTAESATFPSGAVLSFEGNPEANLCIQCHQGRAWSGSVDAAIASAAASGSNPRFVNVHYFAAGATLFGNEAHGAYEYAGKTYVGRNVHVEAADSCVECHNVHELGVQTELCAACHGDVSVEEIRMTATDYDGDGDTSEGIYGEVQTMIEALGTAMTDYSTNTLGDTVTYNGARYPYYFNDAGENYASFDAKLARAAYNYQYAQKDPGGFAHNGKYVMEVLYDSIQDLGGSTAGMTRP
jgi:hypothetical protein